jgi:Fe-S-cluster containining protein
MILSHGERRLRNVDAKCFFLSEKGCSIYNDRPQGCKFYPLVVDFKGNISIDKNCKHHQNHKMKKTNLLKFRMFLNLLRRERRRETPS